jgi:hypothetical protein
VLGEGRGAGSYRSRIQDQELSGEALFLAHWFSIEVRISIDVWFEIEVQSPIQMQSPIEVQPPFEVQYSIEPQSSTSSSLQRCLTAVHPPNVFFHL